MDTHATIKYIIEKGVIYEVRTEALHIARMVESRPVCLGVRHPFGVHGQIFITV
jgi:hypothetical protein